MTTVPILTGRRLPRWSTPVVAAAAILIGLILQFAGMSPLGLAPALVTAITFIVARSAWSWIIEAPMVAHNCAR